MPRQSPVPGQAWTVTSKDLDNRTAVLLRSSPWTRPSEQSSKFCFMSDVIFSLYSWPRAIVHIDADAFFASCEEAIHPELRGKPVVTGAERGIIACASYAAKAKGVKRGVPIRDARKLCPGLVVLPLRLRKPRPKTGWWRPRSH
jgi:hypothetical protein